MKYGAPALAPIQAVAHGILIEKKSEQKRQQTESFLELNNERY